MKLFHTFVILLFPLLNLFAQWSTDPNNNLKVSEFSDYPLAAVEDGRGGIFISTSLNGPLDRPPWDTKTPMLYWLDKFGYNNWSAPKNIGSDAEHYEDLNLVRNKDGDFFAIMINKKYQYDIGGYYTFRHSLFVQKFDSLGNKLWNDGVYVITDTTDQFRYSYAVEGNGGIYIYFHATESFDYPGKYFKVIQYLDNDGNRDWGESGLKLYEDIRPSYGNSVIVANQDDDVYLFYSPGPDSVNNVVCKYSIGGIKLWEVNSRLKLYGTQIFLKADNSVGMLGFQKTDNVNVEKLMYDNISENGEYIDTLTTIIDSINHQASIITQVIESDSNTYFNWQTNERINYFQIFDSDKYTKIDGYGVEPFHSQRSRTKFFLDDNKILLVATQLAQKIDINGNLLWGSSPLQFSSEYGDYAQFVTDNHNGFISAWSNNLEGVWAQQVNTNGELGNVITKIDDYENRVNQPDQFLLYQNYPNPFNPATKIKYSIPHDAYVTLTVYNILGKETARSFIGHQIKGTYSFSFNGSDLSSGLYIYNLKVKYAGKHKITDSKSKKMLLLK